MKRTLWRRIVSGPGPPWLSLAACFAVSNGAGRSLLSLASRCMV